MVDTKIFLKKPINFKNKFFIYPPSVNDVIDEVTKALVIMEIAKVDASVAELIAVHTLTNDIILRNGTEEQKKNSLHV